MSNGEKAMGAASNSLRALPVLPPLHFPIGTAEPWLAGTLQKIMLHTQGTHTLYSSGFLRMKNE